jgi:hypothetical protein
MGSFDTSQPREGQWPQSIEFDFSVDRRGIRTFVTKHFADLVQGSTLLQHVGGEAVTKEVRTLARGFDTCFYQRTLNDLGDRVRDAKPDERSVVTDENPAAGTSWAVSVQILRDGLAHICWQR